MTRRLPTVLCPSAKILATDLLYFLSTAWNTECYYKKGGENIPPEYGKSVPHSHGKKQVWAFSQSLALNGNGLQTSPSVKLKTQRLLRAENLAISTPIYFLKKKHKQFDQSACWK